MKKLRTYIGRGILAALTSATLLGLAPIFGKLALNAGMDAAFLVVLRTTLAVGVLWIAFFIFGRKYIYIYPVGLMACFMAGLINGIGSLFFYASLNFLSASLAQLLYATNPIWLAFLLRLDGQPISKLTGMRLLLALPAIVLITSGAWGGSSLNGVLLMLVGAFMYATHLAVNQHALRDIPAPTVTLYTLTAMAIAVLPAAFFIHSTPSQYSPDAWWGLLGLTVVTAGSRLTLFAGIQRLGGVQSALLGLSELFVSLVAAYFLLGDVLSPLQWIGAALLMTSVGMVRFEKDLGNRAHVSTGWLAWLYSVLNRGTPGPNIPSDKVPSFEEIKAELEREQRNLKNDANNLATTKPPPKDPDVEPLAAGSRAKAKAKD